jgi:hypothetical protein
MVIVQDVAGPRLAGLKRAQRDRCGMLNARRRLTVPARG